MNSGYLYHRNAPASSQELSDILRERPGIPALRLQEQIDAVEFEQADAPWLEGLPTGLWPQGRVFGPLAEVRWWAIDGDGYNVIVLSEIKLSLPDGIWWEQETETSPEYSLYLWGERRSSDSCWIETRIPRLLHYPIDDALWQLHQFPYSVIIARDYIIRGIVQLTRFMELKPKES